MVICGYVIGSDEGVLYMRRISKIYWSFKWKY
jgi:hypothetical protein